MLRILLIGRHGKVGWELERALAPLGYLAAYDRPDFDLARADDIHAAMERERPHVVINAAAYTAVDRAEEQPEMARAVNGVAPGILAEEAARLGAAIIHYSSDYVFDGAKSVPYTEEDSPRPLGVYGQTKLEGEMAVEAAGGAYLIVRTSWVYGLRGESYLRKVMHWANTQREVRVPAGEVGSPTWCRMVAEGTAHMIASSGSRVVPYFKERRGIYHLAGSGFATRLEWARAILANDPRREERREVKIVEAPAAEFASPARRPAFSALDCGKIAEVFSVHLPPWEWALERALES